MAKDEHYPLDIWLDARYYPPQVDGYYLYRTAGYQALGKYQSGRWFTPHGAPEENPILLWFNDGVHRPPME